MVPPYILALLSSFFFCLFFFCVTKIQRTLFPKSDCLSDDTFSIKKKECGISTIYIEGFDDDEDENEKRIDKFLYRFLD